MDTSTFSFSAPHLSPRWPVTFSTVLSSSRLRILHESLEYSVGDQTLLLRDDRECIIDRSSRPGFQFHGQSVTLPCYVVHGRADPSSGCAPEVLVLGAIPPRTKDPGVLGAAPGSTGRVAAGSTIPHVINGGFASARRDPVGSPSGVASTFPLGESDLDACLHHFWSRSRVSSPACPRGNSFGWWRGKVAGDSRSFAQVVRDPAPMADQSARFNWGHHLDGFGASRQGRGAGRQDRGRARPNVWKRNSPELQSSSTYGGSAAAGRWEVAAATQGVRVGTQPDRWALAAMGDQDNRSAQGGRSETNRSNPGNIVPCSHCKLTAHLSARCPSLVCERCGRSGHLQASCMVVLPWECMAQMCACLRVRVFFTCMMLPLLNS
ncbi:uncharacterized protein LOC106866249 isoform X1 [Brachypodium distachyon]|uniref:uncharacterized protein LOC106866249 isoform X1 n=1 Tax=Brachypodium distachyon TaxID=15368 RepID=UPI000D0D2C5B|nr:uncharacterized protein LOC106866249 isoform X1 [Brachypodium distachyon]|eukprot:XP_024315166.1 uncharacterized protein LOC106866249 isoform X1 [Brachypodium distachyon]